MKQKLKNFYEYIRPNVVWMMVMILVVSMLSVCSRNEVEHTDIGETTGWTVQEECRDNSDAEEVEEDLILVGKSNALGYDIAKADYTDGNANTLINTKDSAYELSDYEKKESKLENRTNDGTDPTKEIAISDEFRGEQNNLKGVIIGGTFYISDCNIELEAEEYTYTGEPIEPKVTVEYNSNVLQEDVHYAVSYHENTDVGTATVTVTGCGGEGEIIYSGSEEVTFTIEKATPDIKTLPTAGKIQVGAALGSSDLIGGEVVNGKGVEVPGTFSWEDGTIVPTLADSGVTQYKVRFTPEDSRNYNMVEVGMEVLVDPKPFADVDVSFNEGSVYTYTGKEIKPVVLVKEKDTILEEDKDYKVSYHNNINAATMDDENAPVVAVEGIGDYTGSKSIGFTIDKATPLIQTIPTAGAIQEGQALSASVLTGGMALSGLPTNDNDVGSTGASVVEGTFSWKDGSIVPTLADSGVTKYVVVFTPNDTNNYNTFEFGITVVVEEIKNTDQSGSGGTEEPVKPGAGETDPIDPGSGEVEQPQVGEKIPDKKGEATYKITSSKENAVEVSYVAPKKKTKTVKIPETVTLDDNTVAKVTSIESGAFKKNTKLETVTISKNIKTIGKEAFANCTKLKTVKFGSNVTTIGDKAFYKCTALTKISLPSKVKTIGKSVFEGCKKVTSVTIGKGVTKIGSKAFYGCSKIKTLTIQSSKLTTKNIGSKAFTKTPKTMTVKVPKKKFNAYKSMLIKRGVNKKAKFKKI